MSLSYRVASGKASTAQRFVCAPVSTSHVRPLADGRYFTLGGHTGRTRAFQQHRHRQLTRRTAALEDEVKAIEVIQAEDDPSPFFEPLVRSFMLGVGAGIICEVLHVAFQFKDFAGTTGEQLPNLLPQMYEALSPMFLWDHVAALSSSLLFYVIEAAAIIAILRQYPDDTAQATDMIKNSVTLPKLLLPLKFSNFKRLMYTLLNGKPSLAMAQASDFNAADLSPSVLAFRDDNEPMVLPGPSPSGVRGLEQLLAAPKPETKAKVKPPSLPKLREPIPAPRHRTGMPPSAWDKSVRTDPNTSKRDQELKERKSYLKNFWYAAALSQNLKDKPLEVQMLGRTVVLFRGEDGKPRCLDNVCPHRGAPLSGGWVKKVEGESCVVCPYHGWAFNGEGRLTEVPSCEDGAHWPKRPLVDAYPVEERGGFVWLFFGSKEMPVEERPPIPMCAELEDPNWKAVYGELEFNCNHFSVFENAIDMAHIHYLHGDSFGNQNNPVIHDMQVERDTFHISAKFSIHNKPVSPIWSFTAVERVPVEARAYLPSTSYVRIQLGAGVSMITFVNTVPIDEKRSINRFCLIRNFAPWAIFDPWARNSMYRILGEDKVMIDKLQPEKLKHEVSLQADLPQVAFRKLRQEWINMGYAVPPEATNSSSGTLDI